MNDQEIKNTFKQIKKALSTLEIKVSKLQEVVNNKLKPATTKEDKMVLQDLNFNHYI